MKISNSKKELARIISENGGWRHGVKFFASTCNGIVIGSKSKPKYTSKYGWVAAGGFIDDRIELHSYLKNWHQTILSREEYFHLRHASEAAPEPAGEAKPSIEQLAADYRNAKDYADRKQQEADAAMGEADAALELLYHAGLEIGLDIAIASDDEIESELVITDWRDLREGDVIEMLGDGWNCDNVGKVGVVRNVEGDGYNGDLAILCDIGGEGSDWGFGFKFIRRP